MENILRKKVTVVTSNKAFGTDNISGYYSMTLKGIAILTIFVNSKSYSYRSGIGLGHCVEARVINSYRYNSKKHCLRVEVATYQSLSGVMPVNQIFYEALKAIKFHVNVD